MSIEEKTKLFLAFDYLIKRKIKGNAEAYAKRLGISRSTLFRLIEYMRNDLHAPIHYSITNKRYGYEIEGKLFFGFLPATSLTAEEKKLKGGSILTSANQTLQNLVVPVSTNETR